MDLPSILRRQGHGLEDSFPAPSQKRLKHLDERAIILSVSIFRFLQEEESRLDQRNRKLGNHTYRAYRGGAGYRAGQGAYITACGSGRADGLFATGGGQLQSACASSE